MEERKPKTPGPTTKKNEKPSLESRVKALEEIVTRDQTLLVSIGIEVLEIVNVINTGEMIINELCDLMEKITDVPMKCRANKELEEILAKVTKG
jgi:hypothetical protein